MKSTHRQQAKAKRAGRVHIVTTYNLLDTLFANPDAPMPEAKRRLHDIQAGRRRPHDVEIMKL